MSLLAAAFADGSILLWIVGLVLLEGVVLGALWRSRQVGFAPSALWGQLCSGAALMLAVRAALLDQPWPQIALWLLLALFAHVVDLMLRYRSQRSPS